MTWNLSEFKSGDNFSYTAGKEINGSVADRNTVQYHSEHPNKEYQKCIIASGASISFTAGEAVHLYPGFHAKKGSNFNAKILPPAKITISKIPLGFNDQIEYEVKNIESVELGFYTDQTLDSLVYAKQFFVDTLSLKAATNIDTTLTLKKYYVVGNFYSGRGSQKRVEGWVSNSYYNDKRGLVNIMTTNPISIESTVYPNPSEGLFTVKSTLLFDVAYEVKDAIGIIVLKGKLRNAEPTFEIDLRSKPSGVYYLRVFTNKDYITKKLIKY